MTGAVHDHEVTFYDHDTDVVADLARFVAEGLSTGERVIVVATAAHREELDEVLVQYRADPVRARVTGRYLTFDAAELLAKFMVGAAPDPAKFFHAVGAVIDAAGADGCAVRIYGEMVALLWLQGNVAGALELEGLWNALASTRRFALLCAYPVSVLGGESLTAAQTVCASHSAVRPPRSYARAPGTTSIAESRPDAHATRVFVPVSAAVPAARRFVVETLASWGADAVRTDAALVTSELATNAVEHAVSAFRVDVVRTHDAVRIALEDVGPSLPEVKAAAPDDFGGRGVAIVVRLARRWGCDPAPGGKVVWAELALPAQ
jgi:anti-sigma regulatory factor (Ser/Thr protein kinase)